MSHDASLAVFSDNGLEFAAHSERYSRIKNDKHLNQSIVDEALQYGEPDRICYYERPWLKKTRQLYAKQYTLLKKESPTTYIRKFYNKAPSCTTTSHHLSHSAYAYYTGPYERAVILVIDSIGEWETASIWTGEDGKLKKLWSQKYPDSMGIWYSAMTQRIGLKPQEHEYILMGMAAIGDPLRLYDRIKKDFFISYPNENHGVIFARNSHRGCLDWLPGINRPQDYADIAAATQAVYQEVFQEFCKKASDLTERKIDNLIIVGGCALNCVANPLAQQFFDNIHVPANPGDAGSAIGCVLAQTKQFLEMPHAFLGHDIQGEYPVEKLLEQLHTRKITAVASGRAEFGPRALGNRSILADPRGSSVKDRVNKIKHREAFRPFAPAILQEHASEYFEGITGDFMQYVSECKYPDKFPAIVHYDNTSRVQTVTKQSAPGLRSLLERWYETTGCPMLLNTSLNIKGEPLINTREDADRWTKQYGVEVCVPLE
ncbi:MAG: hypothetical protein CBC78_001880 [Candidatus Pelagibacter sp. TMED118]|nr:MAG: hypothetical protein CBC78_001880 [Candidatus Pelagibacter sp. TMED118]|tara:strand:- start:1537 stop:2997 length:1461 start_codon:yes stop_codon:yes gene_type:complete